MSELPGSAAGAGREIWSVSEILEETRWALESTFNGLWIRGEVTGLRRIQSGHWYFKLKDDQAILDVAMFRGDNISVPFELEEGQEIVALGRLSLYEPQGRFQLIARSLEPAGWGAQQLAFEQLKQRLAGEGMFDASRKVPIPGLPRCVGVVTSARGAAWHDMQRVWSRREVGIRVLLAPARVQGEMAAREIAAAIELLEEHGAAEVIIVGRGGGSREDLWAFNEEPVARAIAAARIPVVSAVGHEIDHTIADLVADVRASTPTAAAEIVAPSRRELLERTGALERRCRARLRESVRDAADRLTDRELLRALAEPARAVAVHQQRADLAWERIEAAATRRTRIAADSLRGHGAMLLRHEPGRAVARRQRRLLEVHPRLRAGVLGQLQKRRESLAATAARTEAMSPLAVLGRGYALCQTPDGALLRDAEAVRPGDAIRVRLARGGLACEVREREPHAEST